MPKPKLCFYVPFYPLIKGGAEYQAKIIALGLKKMGYEIIYISGGHSRNECIHEDGFKIYKLHVATGLYAKLNLYKAHMKEVCAIIDKEKPKLVYQRILNTFTYRLSFFTKKNCIPFVLHIADNYSITFESGQRGKAKKKLFRKIIANQTQIICQTEFQRKKIKEFNCTATVMANMHPTMLQAPLAKVDNRLVWIGNSRPVKQLELYIKLAKLLSASTYDFHVIGNLPDSAYGKTLRDGIQNTPNIIYHGSKNNAFINDFLKKSVLLINTSSSEGFSNTFIQAWMSGTPVLALNSDPDGVMQDYGIGFNCKGDFNQMQEGIERLLANKEDYKHKCEKAIQTANSLFSVEQNINKFKEFLENTMSKS